MDYRKCTILFHSDEEMKEGISKYCPHETNTQAYVDVEVRRTSDSGVSLGLGQLSGSLDVENQSE